MRLLHAWDLSASIHELYLQGQIHGVGAPLQPVGVKPRVLLLDEATSQLSVACTMHVSCMLHCTS